MRGFDDALDLKSLNDALLAMLEVPVVPLQDENGKCAQCTFAPLAVGVLSQKPKSMDVYCRECAVNDPNLWCERLSQNTCLS